MEFTFDHFPIEICMMVFDHLVTDKMSLGTICLVSHNWKTITYASYAWKLWIYAKMGENTPLVEWYMDEHIIKHMTPVVYAQCVSQNIISHHFKMVLAKKFMFSFIDHMGDVKKFILNIWHDLIFTGNVQLLQLLQKKFNITADDARARHNWAIRMACEYGQAGVLEYLHKTFDLTKEDARTEKNYALRVACTNGYIKIVQYLHRQFGLDTDDARDHNNYALIFACNNGHVSIITYLHYQFGLTAIDARDKNNHALRCICDADNEKPLVIKCLHDLFGIGVIDYLQSEYGFHITNENDYNEVLRRLKRDSLICFVKTCTLFGLNANDY